MNEQLSSVILYECDKIGNDLMAWCYPMVEDDVDQTLQRRIIEHRKRLVEERGENYFVGTDNVDQDTQVESNQKEKDDEIYLYSKYKNLWHYSKICKANTQVTPSINSFTIVLLCKNFNPEKYEALLDIFCQNYQQNGDPVGLLEIFIKVFTTSKYTASPNITWANSLFNDSLAMIGSFTIKQIIGRLGVESVILWNALMQGKCVVVLGDDIRTVATVVRALPQFIWHRQYQWKNIRPFVNVNSAEIDEDLTTLNSWIGGFVDPSIQAGTNTQYDILFDLENGVISISDQAKDDLRMGSLHKDLSSTMIELAETKSDRDVIKGLAIKTTEIVSNLKDQFANADTSNNLVQLVENSDLPVNMHPFAINVLLCENYNF